MPETAWPVYLEAGLAHWLADIAAALRVVLTAAEREGIAAECAALAPALLTIRPVLEGAHDEQTLLAALARLALLLADHPVIAARLPAAIARVRAESEAAA